MNKLLFGAVAGAIATVPMTLTMVLLRRQIPRRERRPLPPEQITVSLADKTGAEKAVEGKPERKAISLINHFGYGTATGAVYGVMEDKMAGNPMVKGIGYGLAIWAGSYLGWLPAAGILSPATRHPASQNAMMITAHIVWGAALGITIEGLKKKDTDGEDDQSRTNIVPVPSSVKTSARIPFRDVPLTM